MAQATTVIEKKDDFFVPMEMPKGFKKPVSVVQVAMGELGLVHRRTFNVLVANAARGLEAGQLDHSMPIGVLVDYASGENTHNYQHIYEIGEDLVSTKVRYFDFSKRKTTQKKRAKGVTTLVSSFRVVEDGTVKYSFSKDMRDRLINPEEYVWVDLAVQKRFSSKYEQALYENCTKYLGLGHTGFKPLDDWRQVLGATDSTFDQFKHFNYAVVKKGTKGVSEKSPIKIEAEFKRRGRTVTEMGMKVSENQQMSLLDSKDHARIRATDAFQTGIEAGFSDIEVLCWIEKFGDELVGDALAKLSKATKVSNPAAWIQAGLEKGYAARTPDERKQDLAIKAKAKVQEDQKKAKARLKKLADIKSDIERAYDELIAAELDKWEASLPTDEKEQLISIIEPQTGGGFTLKDFRKYGFKSKFARQYIQPVLTERYPSLWPDIEQSANEFEVESWQSVMDEMAALEAHTGK